MVKYQLKDAMKIVFLFLLYSCLNKIIILGGEFMLCALIMAGGKGERFWPLSTEERPKQFLNLIGNETMIQTTVRRIKELIPMERIFVVTAKQYETLVKNQLPELPNNNIIVEPVGKNTAPCILLSAFYIKRIYNDATIAVLPSDHLITKEAEFREILNRSYEFINTNTEAIVTIGITPTRPETGYGYVKYKKDSMNNGTNIVTVEKFVEKPNKENAKKYLENGNFLWNAGMFLWKADLILSMAEQYINDTYCKLKNISVGSYEQFRISCSKIYESVESISIDYAIMEKAKNIYVIKGDFGWDDVGSWNSVERYSKKTKRNNVYKGKGMAIDGDNNLIVSGNKPIVTLGMDNILVVESSDIIFIADKNSLDKIKDVRRQVSYNY